MARESCEAHGSGDGEMTTKYPEKYHDLQVLLGRLSREMPGTLSGFAHLHKEATASGALSAKFKELMALGIAIAIRCDDCIAYHVHDAMKAGATRAEIIEALGVAIMMGGGPATMYACEAYDALQQYENENKDGSKTAGA
ncbi:MAG: carboxymuconolactone decarboxylase family protein [Roseiarcus sp.]